MPTLKSINAKAGTNFRRTTELVAALVKQKEKPVSHYIIKPAEGTIIFEKASPEQVSFACCYHLNEHGGLSLGDVFDRMMFTARVRFTHMEYVVIEDGTCRLYRGEIPEWGPDLAPEGAPIMATEVDRPYVKWRERDFFLAVTEIYDIGDGTMQEAWEEPVHVGPDNHSNVAVCRVRETYR